MPLRTDSRTFRLSLIALAVVLMGVLAFSWPGEETPPPKVGNGGAAAVEPGVGEVPSVAPEPGPAAPVGAGRRDAARRGAGVELLGIVRNRSGTPIPGVSIDIHGRGGRHEMRSGAGGTFTVASLIPGTYQVTALGPQVLAYREFHELTGESDPIEFTLYLDQGAELVGQVVDPEGRPIVGAQVTPWLSLPDNELDRRCSVTTDVTGRFSARGASENATRVFVEHADFRAWNALLRPGVAKMIRLQRKTPAKE